MYFTVITGHTGWTDDLDFAFLYRKALCKPLTRRHTDPAAPYDGYIEDDDIEKTPAILLQPGENAALTSL